MGLKLKFNLLGDIHKKIRISKKDLKELKEKSEKLLKTPLFKKEKGKIGLNFCDNQLITKVNREFLGRNYPTNVITFNYKNRQSYEESLEDWVGEIFISLEKAKEESQRFGLDFKAYLLHLIFHGLLHYAGYDHEKSGEAGWLMIKKELKYYEAFGLEDKKEEILKFIKRRGIMRPGLAVNVDHVATVREARKAPYPDPVHAAVLAELGGADGIVVHLRLDRRHIKERDVQIIKEIIKTKLILEMAIDKELIKFAKEVKPYQVTLVPERVEEITTEGGMELRGRIEEVKKAVKELNKAGIKVSLFLNPEEEVMELAKKTGAQIVEIHTGIYAEAQNEEEREKELERIENAAKIALDLGFEVHAGHGLSYENVEKVAAIPFISEFSIGHSIISRAIFVGMKEAVREMKKLILRGRGENI